MTHQINSGIVSKPAPWVVDFTSSSASVGVELEMIITNLPDYKDHFKLFEEAFIPLTSELYPKKSLPRGEEPFQIKDDFSIIPGPRFPRARRVEVATPVMTGDRSQFSYHSIIPKMCTTIISTLPKDASIEFNHTTALQVHIGVGDGNTYCLRDLKRICKAIVIFEDHMDTLHPNCRNPPDNANPNPLRRCCASFKLKLLSDAKRLDAIDKQHNAAGLVMLMNSCVGMKDLPKYYKYNLRSLEKFGTIEFRQAVGTVRSEVIVGWIETVIRFVSAAVGTEDEVYKRWAEGDAIGDEDYERFGAPLISVDRDIDSWWGVRDFGDA